MSLRIPQEQHVLTTLVLGNLKPITRPQPTFEVKDTQIHCLSNIYCLVFMTDRQHLVIFLRFPCLKMEFVLDTVKWKGTVDKITRRPIQMGSCSMTTTEMMILVGFVET